MTFNSILKFAPLIGLSSVTTHRTYNKQELVTKEEKFWKDLLKDTSQYVPGMSLQLEQIYREVIMSRLLLKEKKKKRIMNTTCERNITIWTSRMLKNNDCK